VAAKPSPTEMSRNIGATRLRRRSARIRAIAAAAIG
jgi:hypothetical protein